MLYTVGEIARRIGIAPSTIRYYDQKGLLPFVKRTTGGIRRLTDQDYEWLLVVHCLKEAGMQLKDIREFTEMALDGDETTIDERLSLFIQQQKVAQKQMAELQAELGPGQEPPDGQLRLEDIQERYHTLRRQLLEGSDASTPK